MEESLQVSGIRDETYVNVKEECVYEQQFNCLFCLEVFNLEEFLTNHFQQLHKDMYINQNEVKQENNAHDDFGGDLVDPLNLVQLTLENNDGCVKTEEIDIGFDNCQTTSTTERNNICSSEEIDYNELQKSATKRRSFNTHTKQNLYSCGNCQKRFSKGDLNKHMRVHTGEKPYSCLICKKSFSESGNLNRHIITHTRANDGRVKTGEIDISSDNCQTPSKPERNNRWSSEEIDYSELQKSATKSRSFNTHAKQNLYSCDNCHKRFSKSDLNKHMRVHTGEKPYSCVICKKSFSESGNLKRHMLTHTDRKPYCCEICMKTFSQSGDMKRHIITHTRETSYCCDICKKTFSQRRHWESHKISHAGENPYSCHICKKRFSKSRNLKRHTLTHSGKKTYSCEACKKTFSNREYLKSHMRIHTGEKPYICDICQKSFTHISNMKTHRKTHD